ncbi:hypothetical protein JCM8547_008773 [Rhodosporidiobolus lusitaniae]
MEVKWSSITVEWKADKLSEFFGTKEEPKLDNDRYDFFVLRVEIKSNDPHQWTACGRLHQACDDLFESEADSNPVLTASSCYFRNMFSSGFSGTRPVSTSSSVVVLDKGLPLDWINNDDSLEWLPEEWVEKAATSSSSGAPPSDSAADDSTKEQVVVQVTDFGYTTYRAILYYLYTGHIVFHPPASTFLVALDQEEDGSVDLSSRREYLLLRTERKLIKVEPASAHAIYQLAGKIDLPDLKKLAMEAILEGFSVDNHDEIQTATRGFTLQNWDEFRTTNAFDRVFDASLDDDVEIQGARDIWRKLLKAMSYPPPPPSDMPVSFTASLPAGSKPVSDTVGLLSGAVSVSLDSTTSSRYSSSADTTSTPATLDLEKMKEEALEKLKQEAKKAGASGLVECGFEVVVRATGVGVLTVDTL